ncbi:11380_t:CDS:2 [Rhizophagus irregularis]|nr:11380_t:CDS:2 [Rhizophagus irregularis]
MGGNIEIRSLIPLPLFIKSLKVLRNRFLMFLEQITTLDGKSLINWEDLKFRPYSQSMALVFIPSWFKYIKTHSLLPNSYSLPPELQTSSAHNFKGIFITHPSFDNNIKGWTTFWVDRFNSPYFGKIIKKDTIKKKIYVQHFLLSRQNNLTFFDPCHGCVLNNHQNGDCIFIIPHTDLVLIPKNTITQATVRPRMSFDLRDLFQQARFLFQFNRRLISFYQDSIFVKQHNNIITRYIDFSESRNDLLRIQQQLSDTSTLTFYTDGSLIDNGSESCSMSFGFAQACDLSPKVLFTSTSHSGDPWNEFIDSKCSEVHNNNNSSIITLLTDNMKNIHYILNWNNIEVEQSPRKFISQTSKVRGFEEFFNLARNVKYRRTNIDWKSTFEVLSGDDPSNITTFKSSRKKAEKLKFLMEELPTIEQIKKSLPDIYDNWLCPVCSDVIEDFNHIWSCICHVNILQKIDRDSQHFILMAINNNIKSDFCHVSLININSLDNFWDFSIDNNCLTFIDFIKGFIPITLSNYLKLLIFNDKVVHTIIGDLHDFTYNEVMNNIWKPRCELQVVFEKNLSITKKKKLDSRLNFSTNSSFNFINNVNFSSVDYIENSLESLRNNIYFGKDILGFMLHRAFDTGLVWVVVKLSLVGFTL